MNSTPETRYTLIGKLRNPQDAEAWAEFSNIYQPLIFRICRKRGLQHADAIDVTQEVLSKVAQASEKFSSERHGSTFRGWLYRVTQNLVIDFLRKRERNVLAKADYSLLRADDQQPVKNDESAEFRLEFQRQIFWLVAKDVRTQVKPQTWQAFW
ncbi:sigma-70 family RNA polymerase sigma factor, partial [bacterium]|nr:sigma-70 family RNA polymerase sigma factor [bacterium]